MACIFTVAPTSVAVMVARSDPEVLVMPYTDMYAVVPSCITLAFMHEYSVLGVSVMVMNSSADLYDVALNVTMSVAADVNDTESVCDTDTPPVVMAPESKPTNAHILAPE